LAFAQPRGEHGRLDLLQALLLPGLDQAQHGQWWKAAAFVGVEVGLLAAAGHLNARGKDLDADFRAFADAHWDYDRYVAWRMHPGEFALEEGYLDRNIPAEDLAAAATQEELDALFAATDNDEFDPTGGEGSHILPGDYLSGWSAGDNGAWNHFSLRKTQQFYEMIGKYAQFQRGWELYGADNGWEFAAQQPWDVQEFCDQSRSYMAMRSDSNDKLILADRLMGLVVLNHVASFLDVLIQTRREATGLSLRATQLETGRGRRPGLCLGWSF